MINKLQIHQLRNLSQVVLDLAKCNLLIGENGSGKTSLLEAVFLLSRGRSFRHHESKRYISHHQSSCTIWATTSEQQQSTSLAIQKKIDTTGKSDTLLRFNEQPVASQSVLSLHLPVLLIDPVGMNLLDEGSASRRQLLDWLAFHMKPEFYQHWLHYQRLLRQRNSLLKNPAINQNISQLAAWDKQLSIYAKTLHECREEVFYQWIEYFDEMIARLLPVYHNKLYLQYLAGFDTEHNLLDILNKRIKQDIELGYTRIGAHRADVAVMLKIQHQNGQKIREQATHVLSRGEKKLLITALRLSQLQLICHAVAQGRVMLDNSPIVLIDDIDAELDAAAVSILLDTVLSLPCQVIISSLNNAIHDEILLKINQLNNTGDNNTNKQYNQSNGQNVSENQQKSYHMFHVKQGEFTLMYAD